MSDAFGSTFMFKIIIIFIVFFVAFASIAVNYAKTFQLKNKVIDYVEQHQFSVVGINKNVNFKDLDAFLGKNNYKYTKSSNRNVYKQIKKNCEDQVSNLNNPKGPYSVAIPKSTYVTDSGACVIPVQYTINKKTHYFFRISVYLVIQLPIIQRHPFVIPITGETDDFSEKYFINKKK